MSDKLKVEINISSLDNEGQLFNEFYGKDHINLVDGFKVIFLTKYLFTLSESDVDISSLIFDSLGSGINKDKVSFLHIHCHKKQESVTDKLDPRRFKLKLGTNTFDLSQLQLANITKIANFSIEDVEVGVGEKSILSILVGFHTI